MRYPISLDRLRLLFVVPLQISFLHQNHFFTWWHFFCHIRSTSDFDHCWRALLQRGCHQPKQASTFSSLEKDCGRMERITILGHDDCHNSLILKWNSPMTVQQLTALTHHSIHMIGLCLPILLSDPSQHLCITTALKFQYQF